MKHRREIIVVITVVHTTDGSNFLVQTSQGTITGSAKNSNEALHRAVELANKDLQRDE